MNSNPTTVLIAVLYGAGLISIDEVGFKKELSKAADTDEIFEVFKPHPQYRFSQTLDEELSKLVLGGLIIRHGVCNNRGLYFEISPRLAGEFGRTEFEKLTATESEAVKKVAKLIRELWWV